MELIGISTILADAKSGHYAVGAFNFCNAETAQAIVGIACELRSPVILLIGPCEIPLLGAKTLGRIARLVAEEADVPVCLHLDHADDIPLVRECIDAGFPSVMIDASARGFDDNIGITRQVVEMARDRGVTVEGELGAVGSVGRETPEGASGASLTDPSRAAEFAERTGVDALAVAIGNAHGIYTRRPELDFDRLSAIAAATNVPLVLHGGSGTPPDQLARAIEIGITKVNVASEISRAFLAAVCAPDRPAWYAHALVNAKEAAAEVTKQWMRQLGSANRA